MRFSFGKFFKSFTYAAKGIAEVYKREQNFKVHTLAAMVALFLGWFFKVSPWEWCFLAVVIALVMAAEMVNTAMENLCDVTHPEKNETIRVVKDVSAGMVLVCAIGALVVGIVIFLPKIIAFLQNL
ncbi:MAG: diacylglycerol kinase family protein [Ruminococcaceae bacterium]|nr:diacylglycerol kinase family protein [Oscillospiraceae bacterium]